MREVDYQRSNSHSVSRLSVHLVWSTTYRYSVREGDIKVRCRSILIQIGESEDVRVLKGVVSKDHVHRHIEYPPSKSIRDLVKHLKGRSSRKLQQEFPDLKKRHWGRHCWAIGFGCWSTGNITDAMLNEYLKHRCKPIDDDQSHFILE